jgi:putative transposase
METGVTGNELGMKYQPETHHRRSIRLMGYDYNQSGMYFVTVVTQDRLCMFGVIENGTMRLNDAGCIVQAAWEELPAHYAGVKTDVFVVMPNHIHGIVVLVGAGPRACPDAGSGVVRQAPVPARIRDRGLQRSTVPAQPPGAHWGAPLQKIQPRH